MKHIEKFSLTEGLENILLHFADDKRDAKIIIHSCNEMGKILGYSNIIKLTTSSLNINIENRSWKIGDRGLIKTLYLAWNFLIGKMINRIDVTPREELFQQKSEMYHEKLRALIKNKEITFSSDASYILSKVLNNPINFSGVVPLSIISGSKGLVAEVKIDDVLGKQYINNFQQNYFIILHYLIDNLLDPDGVYKYCDRSYSLGDEGKFLITGDGWKLLEYKNSSEIIKLSRSNVLPIIRNAAEISTLNIFKKLLFRSGAQSLSQKEKDIKNLILSLLDKSIFEEQWTIDGTIQKMTEKLSDYINKGVLMDYYEILQGNKYYEVILINNKERVDKLSKASKLLQRK